MKQIQLLFGLLCLGEVLDLFPHVSDFLPEVQLGQFRWP